MNKDKALEAAAQIIDNDLRVRVVMAVAAENYDELWAAREYANRTWAISVRDWDRIKEVLEQLGAQV